jgi:hypothetical protein
VEAGVHVQGVSLTGEEVARARYKLIKEGEQQKEYRVISINQKTGVLKLEGDLRTFETNLQKALDNGYKLIKDK